MTGLASTDYTSGFCSVGIDYKETSLTERGSFSICSATRESMLEAAKQEQLEGLLILSTCNRTELYSSNATPRQLKSLFARFSEASETEIRKYLWEKHGMEAISHLFRVSSGLESNILGDLQIVGQVKKAWKECKAILPQSSRMERWLNSSIGCSKKVKNKTSLSDGCASVSYMAVQSVIRWSKKYDLNDPSILLMGLGEIGRNCGYNILKHMPQASLTVCNRSEEKAMRFAESNGLETIKWGSYPNQVKQFDVVVVGTGAQHYVISTEIDFSDRAQLFMDLSVPRNIDPTIGEWTDKTLIDLDQLGKQTDATLTERRQAIPEAEKQIAQSIEEFSEWLEVRQYAYLMKWLKTELGSLQEQELERFQRKNPDADMQAAQAVSKHMIHSLTAKVAQFINTNHRDLTQELSHVQAKIQSQA